MERFGNARAQEAHDTGLVSGLPKPIGRKAHWVIRLLVATHSWQDVRVIGAVAVWSNYPDHYGLLVDGKWYLTFKWDSMVGPVGIRLERK